MSGAKAVSSLKRRSRPIDPAPLAIDGHRGPREMAARSRVEIGRRSRPDPSSASAGGPYVQSRIPARSRRSPRRGRNGPTLADGIPIRPEFVGDVACEPERHPAVALERVDGFRRISVPLEVTRPLEARKARVQRIPAGVRHRLSLHEPSDVIRQRSHTQCCWTAAGSRASKIHCNFEAREGTLGNVGGLANRKRKETL